MPNQQFFPRKKYHQTQQGDGWIQNPVGSGLLVPTAPPTDAVLRAPLFAPIFKAVALAAAIISQPVPNLLASTLAPVAAVQAPFTSAVLDVPEHRREQLDVFFSPTNIALLTPLAVLPFSETDWPNPTSRPQFVQQQPGEINLSTTLTQPFEPVEFPNPERVRDLDTESQARNLSLLAPVVQGAAPFSQTDWPNPSRKAENLEAHGYTNRQPPEEEVVIPPTDATIRAPFFVQELKPPEELAAILSQPHSNIALLTAEQAAAPFRNVDWPNPTRKPRFAQQTLEGLNLSTTLTQPFKPVDFFLTSEQVREILDLPAPNLLATTLQPVVEAVPFNSTDWPNPTRVREFVGDIQARNYALFASLLPSAAPFSQLDWPNPSRPPFPSMSNLGFIEQTKIAFVPAPGIPASGRIQRRHWFRSWSG